MPALLNWVDLVVVTIFLRTLYGGFSRGILTELLTLVGAVVTTVAAVVLWRPVASWIGSWLWVPHHVLGMLIFWAIFLGVSFGSRQLRTVVGQIVKWESFHWSIQGLGVCVGGLRGFWWAGFVLLVLVSSGYPFLEEAVMKRSAFGPRILRTFGPYLDQVADRVPGPPLRGGTLIPSVQSALGGEQT